MPSVETIYRETVRPLPVEDQRRLADIILKNVEGDAKSTVPKRSALEIIRSMRATTASRTAAEIDESLRAERDSWDD